MSILINGYTASEWARENSIDSLARVPIHDLAQIIPMNELHLQAPNKVIHIHYRYFAVKEWSSQFRWHEYDPSSKRMSEIPVTQLESDKLNKV
jgi:hypothetical protein